MAKKSESTYYSFKEIDRQKATYNLIVGQRSNGKTFGALRKVLDEYLKTGTPSAYIRRLDSQIMPSYIDFLFDPHIDYLTEQTQGKYNGFQYYRHAFYLARYEEDSKGTMKKVASDKKPMCRTYAINTFETTKGADPGPIKYVIFDEFITRKFYLRNEFVHFQNLLSSIIRNREGVTIYMLANTVNKFCPYFAEMGLKEIDTMKLGDISVYKVGQTQTKIAVEYCATSAVSKKVSSYFAFDNPRLKMITTGEWEIALYRHAPQKLSENDIIFTFFVIFSEKVIQGDIYIYNGYPIIFFHPKTTDLKHPESDVIYYQEVFDGNPLHMMTLSGGHTKAQRLIEQLIKENRTFFNDNQTGEIVNNWLKFALTPKLLK